MNMEENNLSNNNYEVDEDYYSIEPEGIEGECPDCKSNKMTKYMEANGPDDYRYVYECLNCGATYTE